MWRIAFSRSSSSSEELRGVSMLQIYVVALRKESTIIPCICGLLQGKGLWLVFVLNKAAVAMLLDKGFKLAKVGTL